MKEFEELYNENNKKVYKLALSLSGNEKDAEDIMQEAFYRAYANFQSFRGESSFFTWIYRITLNVANKYLKQRKKMVVDTLVQDYGYKMEELIDDNPSSDPEHEYITKEAMFRCLHCIIECLPSEQRKIFCLAISLGLPHKIVAEIMECSLAKVKTTLHRAKKRWFGYMENRCQFMNKNNPCKCNQWVKFGRKQGWVNKHTDDVEFKIDPEAVRQIKTMRDLRDIYFHMYPEDFEESFTRRIKDGIKNKEFEKFL